MRLITFVQDGKQKLGAWVNDDRQIVDLAAAAIGMPFFASMQAFIEAGDMALMMARAFVEDPSEDCLIETSSVRIVSPLPRPVQVRDCLCFPGHLEGIQRMVGERMIAADPDPTAKRAQLEAAGYFEVAKSFYDFPLYYIANSQAVVGPDVDVVWPPYSQMIDYELEWAAIIGKQVQGVSADAPRDYIFGYTVFNDWSARDEQGRVMGGALNLGPSSGKDFANSMGPCIVTADEVSDPYNLKMRVSINGEQVSEGSTQGMHWRFEDLIAHLTRGHALYPGEVICSGTVGGGSALEIGRFVQPGDEIAMEVEGIGVLRNRVVAPHISSVGADAMELAKSLETLRKA
jgi:2-keto-4-pentenoate hydratase/2-oxohepta-3-ene-1,7-dioic acid hydratase in catechol pathway